MLTKLLTSFFNIRLIIIVLTYFISASAIAQITNSDSLATVNDSLQFVKKEIVKKVKKKSKMNLVAEAIYIADDSLIMDKANQKAYLYHNAIVKYDGIILKAEYIELDFKKNTVYAIGLPDSAGVIHGSPVFKDHGDEYNAAIIRYNFDSKKGLISDVTKTEGEMFVWLKKGKKLKNSITYVETGHFTTCSAKHPHYRIRFKKGKIIPNDKIVTGPIYMEVEDIPIPLVIPFGFIPNTNKRSNGVLIPSYGYTENRGYNLTDGGYYWGLGRHLDLSLRGDIYTRGSWGIKALSRYNFRYRGSGSLNFKYAYNKYGETDTKNFNEDKSFFFKWQHRQDPKANPYSSFSANVNFGSKSYNKLNSNNTTDYLQNTFHSSIAYSARIGDGYNFTASINHSQNSQTGSITLTAPQLAFSTPRFNPFKRKNPIGPKRWYEKISLSYKMDTKNTLTTIDTNFFNSTWKDFDKAVKHVIPLSSTVNLGHWSWTNSLNLTERWYFQHQNRFWENDTIFEGTDTIAPHLVTEQVEAFSAVHEFNYSSSINTRIYGMFMFRKGPVKALRHVLTPNLSFNYHPDFGNSPYNYYQEYTDKNGDTIRYNIYEGQMYGSPSDGKSGRVALNFGNNFEIKVRNRKDTIKGTKKIKLIDNLTIGTSYNLAAKEFALAPLTVTARTTLYKGLSVRYAGYWDFYGIDSTGNRINKFNWDLGNSIFRKTKGIWNLGFNYRISSNTKKKKKYKSNKGSKNQLNDLNNHLDDYVDFNNAWAFNLSYNFSNTNAYNVTQMQYDNKIVQTLGINGSINITNKWKIGVRTGWDFQANKISIATIDIYRDLHCWELMFNWIPIGPRRSYNLTIRVKSPMLQDLKLNRKRNWRDY